MNAFLALCGMLCFSTACGGGGEDNNGINTDVSVTVQPNSVNAVAEGGSFDLAVTATGEWSAAATNGETWFQLSPSYGTSGAATVTLTVSDNQNFEERQGQVTIRSGSVRQYIDIKQAAAQKPVVETLEFDAQGGEVEVPVKLNGAWSATSTGDWFTLVTTGGNGGSVKLNMQPNESLILRTGTLLVEVGTAKQTVTLIQKGDHSLMTVCPIGEEYELVWSDAFDTDGDLSNDWRHEVQSAGWVNHERQTYVNKKSPSGQKVTEVKDGVLSINCFKEGDKIYSGRVYAKDKTGWTYGYIEAAINLPSGKGTWPAFWMMPVNFRRWPDDGEIDIMEEVGYHRDYVSSSLHATGHVHSNNTQVTHEMYCKGAEGSYHVYGIEWTADYIQTYVDGKKQLYYKNPGTGRVDWPYDDPFYIILNLAWGGDWGGSQGVDESALPITMKVDYVRVFQKK